MTQPSPGPFVKRHGDVLVLGITCKQLVDYDVADALGQEMLAAVSGEARPQVVVDLSGLEFLSSVGFAPLIVLRNQVRRQEGRLILADMSPLIREVFEATRLLVTPNGPKSLFEYRESVDSAVAELTGQGEAGRNQHES